MQKSRTPKSQIPVRNRSLKKYLFHPPIVRCTFRTENKIDISKLFYENKLALFYFSLHILFCIKPTDLAMCYLLCKGTPAQEKNFQWQEGIIFTFCNS